MPTTAFVTTMRTAKTTGSTTTTLFYSVHDEHKPLQCFLILNDNNSDSVPTMIWTPNPDEYAWFNGIDRKNMVEVTNQQVGWSSGASTTNTSLLYNPFDGLQCVERESPRGVSEWECEAAFQ